MWNTAAVERHIGMAIVHLLVKLRLKGHGVWERAARVWNTAAVEMLMRLVEIEMPVIGQMGHRGLVGHRLVK